LTKCINGFTAFFHRPFSSGRIHQSNAIRVKSIVSWTPPVGVTHSQAWSRPNENTLSPRIWSSKTLVARWIWSLLTSLRVRDIFICFLWLNLHLWFKLQSHIIDKGEESRIGVKISPMAIFQTSLIQAAIKYSLANMFTTSRTPIARIQNLL
jgi:hypothetical protein